MLLAWSPYTLLDAGFQLSFAAVAAIFLVVPRTQRFLEGYPVPQALADVRRRSRSPAASSPRRSSWLQFGRIPLYSVPANALAAPVVAPLLGLSFAAALANPVSPAAAALIAVGERLARRVPRLVRALRRRASRARSSRRRRARRAAPRRVLARPRRPAARGAAPREGLTMLAARGGRAQVGLPAHRQRPPEDRARPPPSPRPVRRGRGRAALRAGHDRRRRRRRLQRDGPLRRRRPARRSSKRSSAGRRRMQRRSPTTWPRPRPTPCSRSSARSSARTRRSRRPARRRASSSSTRSRKRELPKWVAEQFARHGVKATGEACRALVELIGENPHDLASEIDKLSLYAGHDEIAEHEVELLVAARADVPPFVADRRVGEARRRRSSRRVRVDPRALDPLGLRRDPDARRAPRRARPPHSVVPTPRRRGDPPA